jgi:hypothetical protein
MAALTKLTRSELDSRLDAVGWGLLLLATGVILLVPDAPDGSWLMAVGAVLLAMTAVRAYLGARFSWFVAILGAVALVSGIGKASGNAIPGFELLLIVSGGALILGQFIRAGDTLEAAHRPANGRGVPG